MMVVSGPAAAPQLSPERRSLSAITAVVEARAAPAAPAAPPASAAAIPRFFFPGGAPPPPPQVLSARAQAFESLLSGASSSSGGVGGVGDAIMNGNGGNGSGGVGLTIPMFKDLMRDVFDLPSSLAYPLFTRLVPAGGGGAAVPAQALRAWVDAHGGLAASPETRMFDILRGESGGGGGGGGGSAGGGASGMSDDDNDDDGNNNNSRGCSPSSSSRHYSSPSSPGSDDVVTADGLKALLAGVLLSHPGLEFLQDAPEFQDR